MSDQIRKKKIQILSKKELDRTLKRLASQILEKIPNISSLLLIGIPTRGVYLSKLLENIFRNYLFSPLRMIV